MTYTTKISHKMSKNVRFLNHWTPRRLLWETGYSEWHHQEKDVPPGFTDSNIRGAWGASDKWWFLFACYNDLSYSSHLGYRVGQLYRSPFSQKNIWRNHPKPYNNSIIPSDMFAEHEAWWWQHRLLCQLFFSVADCAQESKINFWLMFP